MLITLRDELRIVAQIRRVCAGEEAHDVARAARPVGFASAQRSEQRIARVLLGPHHGKTAGIVVAATRLQPELPVRGRVVVHPGVTEERVLARVARRRIVGVGVGDEAEAERVGAEALFLDEPLLQHVADIRRAGEGLVGIAGAPVPVLMQ